MQRCINTLQIERDMEKGKRLKWSAVIGVHVPMGGGAAGRGARAPAWRSHGVRPRAVTDVSVHVSYPRDGTMLGGMDGKEYGALHAAAAAAAAGYSMEPGKYPYKLFGS